MWGEIIEGECNGYNYYDAESEFAVYGWDDDSCICPSEYSKPKNKSQIWKCKDGSTMLISEMTDKHLENSINYCLRKGKYKTVEILESEKSRRVLEKRNEEFESRKIPCQFCGEIMKVKGFEIESRPEESTGGWGWNYTDYRLVCGCGAMGPVIQTEGFKP